MKYKNTNVLLRNIRIYLYDYTEEIVILSTQNLYFPSTPPMNLTVFKSAISASLAFARLSLSRVDSYVHPQGLTHASQVLRARV